MDVKGARRELQPIQKRSMTMSQMRNAALIALSVLLATWINVALADSAVPAGALAGSWIVDAGPNQIKRSLRIRR